MWHIKSAIIPLNLRLSAYLFCVVNQLRVPALMLLDRHYEWSRP